MKINNKHILSFGALLLLASSCYYDNKEDLYKYSDHDCDTTDVTYSGTIRPILNNECITCHGGSSPAAGLDYTQYSDVLKVANSGELVKRIKGQGNKPQMPLGRTPLPACNILQIETWVNAGAPNN